MSRPNSPPPPPPRPSPLVDVRRDPEPEAEDGMRPRSSTAPALSDVDRGFLTLPPYEAKADRHGTDAPLESPSEATDALSPLGLLDAPSTGLADAKSLPLTNRKNSSRRSFRLRASATARRLSTPFGRSHESSGEMSAEEKRGSRVAESMRGAAEVVKREMLRDIRAIKQQLSMDPQSTPVTELVPRKEVRLFHVGHRHDGEDLDVGIRKPDEVTYDLFSADGFGASDSSDGSEDGQVDAGRSVGNLPTVSEIQDDDGEGPSFPSSIDGFRPRSISMDLPQDPLYRVSTGDASVASDASAARSRRRKRQLRKAGERVLLQSWLQLRSVGDNLVLRNWQRHFFVLVDGALVCLSRAKTMRFRLRMAGAQVKENPGHKENVHPFHFVIEFRDVQTSLLPVAPFEAMGTTLHLRADNLEQKHTWISFLQKQAEHHSRFLQVREEQGVFVRMVHPLLDLERCDGVGTRQASYSTLSNVEVDVVPEADAESDAAERERRAMAKYIFLRLVEPSLAKAREYLESRGLPVHLTFLLAHQLSCIQNDIIREHMLEMDFDNSDDEDDDAVCRALEGEVWISSGNIRDMALAMALVEKSRAGPGHKRSRSRLPSALQGLGGSQRFSLFNWSLPNMPGARGSMTGASMVPPGTPAPVLRHSLSTNRSDQRSSFAFNRLSLPFLGRLGRQSSSDPPELREEDEDAESSEDEGPAQVQAKEFELQHPSPSRSPSPQRAPSPPRPSIPSNAQSIASMLSHESTASARTARPLVEPMAPRDAADEAEFDFTSTPKASSPARNALLSQIGHHPAEGIEAGMPVFSPSEPAFNASMPAPPTQMMIEREPTAALTMEDLGFGFHISANFDTDYEIVRHLVRSDAG